MHIYIYKNQTSFLSEQVWWSKNRIACGVSPFICTLPILCRFFLLLRKVNLPVWSHCSPCLTGPHSTQRQLGHREADNSILKFVASALAPLGCTGHMVYKIKNMILALKDVLNITHACHILELLGASTDPHSYPNCLPHRTERFHLLFLLCSPQPLRPTLLVCGMYCTDIRETVWSGTALYATGSKN